MPGSKEKTKFKIRCSRYLYTLSLDDPEKAEKLKQSLPPGASRNFFILLYTAHLAVTMILRRIGLNVIDVDKIPKKK